MNAQGKLYNLLVGQEVKGPYTLGQIRSMWKSGSVTADVQYAEVGGDAWHPVLSIAEAPAAGPPVGTKIVNIIAAFCVAFGLFMAVAYFFLPPSIEHENAFLEVLLGLPPMVGLVSGVVLAVVGVLVRILGAVASREG